MDIGERNLTRSRANINPRDKSTIFSIYPQPLFEEKITLFPRRYQIDAGSLSKPASLVVGAAYWVKDIPESNQLLDVVDDSETVAKSIIRDFCDGLFEATADAHPGLFYVTEEISVELALKKYPELFQEADRKQKNYYLNLVNFADKIWAQQPNPKMIGHTMRVAAQELGMDKDWMKNFEGIKLEKCPACGVPRDINYPVCSSCNRIVDTKLYKERGLVEAK